MNLLLFWSRGRDVKMEKDEKGKREFSGSFLGVGLLEKLVREYFVLV